MSDTLFERIMEILDEARELRGQERARFLETACGDDDVVRAEVLSLLRQADTQDSPQEVIIAGLHHGAMRDLFSDATNALGTAARGVADDDMQAPLPDTIGPFRIVRRIATGGMGTVFEAEQRDPERRVALKTMRPELFTPALLKRFRREAQILGRLQHPGIAQVFEAGTVEQGGSTQPYFAMEFVDGKPLGAFAADEGLDQRGRLRLFAQICDAVHHAHSGGVVHRDLKPDNILVTADGQAKILDFGIARITDSGVAAPTIVTEVGQIMGTLPYMSPEQVSGHPDDIDARSDVYALGVLLFELLSGRRPHELSDKTLPDAARIIREEEATRLGSVASRWRGDVETIVGKALEKDSDRRYAGADALAADVRRHLSDQPITARAPSRLYVVRKFAQRHTGLVIGSALAVLALVAGLAFSLSFAFDEAQQRREAEFNGYRALMAAAMAALDDGDRLVARSLLNEAPDALRGWEWRHAAARAEPLLWQLELGLTPPEPWQQLFPLVAFSPDDRLLAALVADDRLDVFEAETGTRLHSIKLSGPLSRNCLAATAAGFLTITRAGHVAHWDGTTGELLTEDFVPGIFCRMSWDEASRRLAVTTHTSTQEDGGNRLHVGRIGSIQTVMPGDTDYTVCTHELPVDWANDGKLLANLPDGRGGATLADRVMDDTGEPTLSLRRRLNANRVYAKHEDRLLVIPTGGRTDKLVVCDLNGHELVPLDPHLQHYVVHGAFSADGRRIVTTSAAESHRIVTVYDAASGHAFARWPSGHEALGTLSATGRMLAIGSPDHLAVLSLDSPATTVLPGADDYVYELAWTPDGRTLWARNFDMSSRAYDVVEATVVLDVPRPDHRGLGASIFLRTWGASADGRRIVATHHLLPDGIVMGVSTHDLVSGARWQELPGATWDGVDDYEPDYVVQMARTSRLRFLLATGAIGPSELPTEDLVVTRASGSHPRVLSDPSGQLLVGPLALYLERVDGTDRVPLLIDGQNLPDSEWHTASRNSDASFSPDGKLLAAVRPGLHEGAVVHDVTSGDSEVKLLTGLKTNVQLYSVAFSPDGRRLAVAGTDRVVSLFDTTNWQLVARLEGHLGYIKDIAWSPDGDTLATAGGDGTVRLWSTSPLAERTAAAHAAAALREQQHPWVAGLFDLHDDPYAVADAVRAETSLDDDERHAALRVVRELADVWWAAHDDGSGDR